MTDDQAQARPAGAFCSPWPLSDPPPAPTVVHPSQAFLNGETSSALLASVLARMLGFLALRGGSPAVDRPWTFALGRRGRLAR